VTNVGTMRGGGAAALLTGARAVPHRGAAHDTTAIHPVVRWAFYAFVFSLPFEYPDRSFAVEITTLTGCVFLLATIVQPRACFGERPWAFWWFVAYLWVVGVTFTLTGGENADAVGKSALRFLQQLLILLAAYNVMRRERIRTTTLLLLVAACLVLALLQLSGAFGAPMAEVEDAANQLHRITVLGQNPNRTANMLSLGVLALIGLHYGRQTSVRRARFLMWPVVTVLVLAILQSGSRGAIVALGAALCTFAAGGQTLRARVRNALMTLFALVTFVWVSYESPLLRERFDKAETGNLAGREEIFPAAFEMFQERPLLGWGPMLNKHELATRLQPPPPDGVRDTHNLVLELLTATGLLGSVPFFVGLGLCVWSAWHARRGSQGILPLAMMAALLAANMSGNYEVYLPHCLVLAYALASRRIPAAPGRAAIGRTEWRSWDAARST